jgi:hypothetical protein
MLDLRRLSEINQIFTPGAPVQTRDLFSGRKEQLGRAIEAVTAPGRHPILFGQRGVGKTSLANVLDDVLQNLNTIKISCDGGDSFATIWNRVFSNASVNFKQQAMGFNREDAIRSINLGELLGHDPQTVKPAEVGELLTNLRSGYSVLILDEFDKITDRKTKSAFADLIKILSDKVSHVTLLIVGVARNIHELIGEHPSIDRNLVQIDMPIMNDEEILGILTGGFSKLKISTSDGVMAHFPTLTSGYPHYAHLLGLCCTKVCMQNSTNILTHELFTLGCNLAVADAIEKYRDAYAEATMTSQASRYPIILCACGYADCDARGVFRATDVVDAVKEVFNLDLAVQAVVPALGEFLTERRGRVLEAVPVGKRQCYRLSDPMMRPFLRLKSRDVLTTL